jgi:rsbT co-antagonist protein RsbR
MDSSTRIPDVLSRHEGDILADWIRQLLTGPQTAGRLRESDVREQCRDFLAQFRQAVQDDGLKDTSGPRWRPVRELLAEISRSRTEGGGTPSETAAFVFSLKLPLFARLRQEHGNDGAGLAADVWSASVVLDDLALYTTEVSQTSRDAVIARQQQELLELSTPVVKLWEGILALPLIGTLDSARTQVVMESLLQQIVASGASIAIIDITGVPTVDTLVAQHLLKTVAAARLMGADCIISGIRPQIAQTIVHLGVALGDVVTKATLADAFSVALTRAGARIVRQEHSPTA